MMKAAAVFTPLLRFAAGLAALCVITGGWALYIERPDLTYENLPFPAELRQVRAGQVMPLTVRRCNHSTGIKAYVITHALVNVETGAKIIMPDALTTMQPGCETVTSTINLVPTATPPGRYYVSGAGIIEGRIRTWVVPWTSEAFEVAGGPGG